MIQIWDTWVGQRGVPVRESSGGTLSLSSRELGQAWHVGGLMGVLDRRYWYIVWQRVTFWFTVGYYKGMGSRSMSMWFYLCKLKCQPCCEMSCFCRPAPPLFHRGGRSLTVHHRPCNVWVGMNPGQYSDAVSSWVIRNGPKLSDWLVWTFVPTIGSAIGLFYIIKS